MPLQVILCGPRCCVSTGWFTFLDTVKSDPLTLAQVTHAAAKTRGKMPKQQQKPGRDTWWGKPIRSCKPILGSQDCLPARKHSATGVPQGQCLQVPALMTTQNQYVSADMPPGSQQYKWDRL
jgi:hypothetical protein